MPRQSLALSIPDLSAFARTLGLSLQQRAATRPTPPGHVEMLNLIARALGHRNIQALRAMPAPPTSSASFTPASKDDAPTPLNATARKAMMQFDAQGRLVRWPIKYSVQTMVMWALWTRFEARRVYTEKEVNAILKDAQTYGDHVTLRRELINHRLMSRKSDCSEYRKLAARPDDETRAFVHAWRAQVRAAVRPRAARYAKVALEQ